MTIPARRPIRTDFKIEVSVSTRQVLPPPWAVIPGACRSTFTQVAYTYPSSAPIPVTRTKPCELSSSVVLEPSGRRSYGQVTVCMSPLQKASTDYLHIASDTTS